jgi:hypothetical protein
MGTRRESKPWQISYRAATWKEQWFCQARGCRKEPSAESPCDGETEAIQAQLKPMYGWSHIMISESMNSIRAWMKSFKSGNEKKYSHAPIFDRSRGGHVGSDSCRVLYLLTGSNLPKPGPRGRYIPFLVRCSRVPMAAKYGVYITR